MFRNKADGDGKDNKKVELDDGLSFLLKFPPLGSIKKDVPLSKVSTSFLHKDITNIKFPSNNIPQGCPIS